MSLAFASAAQRFDAAQEAYRSGRPADGARLLDAVLQTDPRSAPALHLMGLCLTDLGDLAGAERALRASLSTDKRRPPVHVALAEVLQRLGRPAEAEKAYRAGLALDRRHPGSAAGLAGLLLTAGRAREALQLTLPLAAAAGAPAAVLEVHAEALRRLGRPEEALAFDRRAVAAGSPFGEIALAGTLRELGRHQEAEEAARRAVAAVGEHPVAMNALGQVLRDLGRLEESEGVYRQALTRAPFDPMLHLGLASLIWARTGDPGRAAAALDSVLRQRTTTPLLAVRAKLHTRSGQPAQAYALLAEASTQVPDDPMLHAAAATAAVHAGQVEAGLVHAERAHALAPGVGQIRALLAEAQLAAGQPERALGIVADLVKQSPEDQQYLALQAVAWRLTGDPRYRGLYDYEAMVGVFTLEPPEGWSSLEAYLADLAVTLKAMHAMGGDPLDQSVRKGAQTEQNLALSADPVVQAFFKAVEAPVADYLARLGKGRDPLRARNGSGHRIKTAWSVKLEPDGFHADHLHPDGWLSSAFYVELPKAMGDDQAKQGWLKFGQPGAPTRPALEPEHFVRPEPGRLVLFPSYMWHGTVPFGGDETRLTMAFDVVPGK
ncbi:MAG TPA: tetratricopeptide repeat protein [Caulobacteraceae bacterium]|jgi:predicted Zn-dependent protease|nr:tetratricopeptide repeat protein [Caulobacteraceae bacterium]